jgi:hypothetical protein
MSRRCHHGSPRHAHIGRDRTRPAIPDRAVRTDRALGFNRPETAEPRSLAPYPSIEAGVAAPELEVEIDREAQPVEREAQSVGAPPPSAEAARSAPIRMPAPPRERRHDGPRLGVAPASATPAQAAAESEDPTVERGATAPQLRRFIKSRAYVPMHELRRRFAINGGDDDVTVVELERQRVYVGLPEREGRLLGELLRGGDIGFELSLDPISPIVVGVYPMRPVTRA